MSGPIEFYFDFLSPYGYLAATKIDDLAAKYGRRVIWRPFLLGVTVLKVMGLRPVMETPLKADYIRQDLPRLAKLLGVPLNLSTNGPTNSRAAARAFYWVQDKDEQQAKELALVLLTRQWVRGEDITEAETVADEAARLGIDREDLLVALRSVALEERLRQEVNKAIERGVFGSPTFCVDKEILWGADRLWMLEHWLRHGSWEPTPANFIKRVRK
jgi:2-hydroxychromene-2-carboxylate isomerase